MQGQTFNFSSIVIIQEHAWKKGVGGNYTEILNRNMRKVSLRVTARAFEGGLLAGSWQGSLTYPRR
jgi:hypothetical protein